MNKVNLKGITPEVITGVIILLVALVNTILQIFNINILPIENDEISKIVSAFFLVVPTIWNTWKNRNITTLAQEMQQITDAVKNGEILVDDVKVILDRIKKQRSGD